MSPFPVPESARRTTLTLFSGLGAFETSADGAWDFVSPGFLEMLGGLPASSLLGREWINRIHPADAQRALAEYRQAREFRRPWAHQLRMMAADSVPIWLSFNAFPLPADSDTRGVVFMGIAKDITAEMRARDLASEAAQTLIDLAEFITEGLIITRDRFIIAANTAAARIHKCASPDELIGRRVDSLIYPGDESRFIPDPIPDGEFSGAGRAVRVGTGDPVLIAFHSRPIAYAGARARIFSFVPVDDPHVQTALEDRNFRRLQNLESLLPIAYHRVSLDGADKGTIEYANERFAALIGCTPADMIGHSIVDFTRPEEAELARANVIRFAESDGLQPMFRRCLLRADGGLVWTEMNSSVYRDPISGHAVSMVLTTRVDGPAEAATTPTVR